MKGLAVYFLSHRGLDSQDSSQKYNHRLFALDNDKFYPHGTGQHRIS